MIRVRSFTLLALGVAALTQIAAAPALHYGVYGSKGSRTYHDRDACKTGSKIKFDRLVQFTSEYDAQQQGRTHCKACLKITAN